MMSEYCIWSFKNSRISCS